MNCFFILLRKTRLDWLIARERMRSFCHRRSIYLTRFDFTFHAAGQFLSLSFSCLAHSYALDLNTAQISCTALTPMRLVHNAWLSESVWCYCQIPSLIPTFIRRASDIMKSYNRQVVALPPNAHSHSPALPLFFFLSFTYFRMMLCCLPQHTDVMLSHSRTFKQQPWLCHVLPTWISPEFLMLIKFSCLCS